MSLYEMTFDWLTVKPEILFDGPRLSVRTSLLVRILSLFLYRRTVTVDLQMRAIQVSRTLFWFFASTRSVPFERVERIDYRFGSMLTDFSYAGTTDQVETFTVALVLRDPSETLVIARVSGEGSKVTGWGGVLLGDDVVDVRGAQEEHSRELVDVLQSMLGVPLVKPTGPARDAAGNAYVCRDCLRPSPASRSKCQYCGGPIEIAGSSQERES